MCSPQDKLWELLANKLIYCSEAGIPDGNYTQTLLKLIQILETKVPPGYLLLKIKNCQLHDEKNSYLVYCICGFPVTLAIAVQDFVVSWNSSSKHLNFPGCSSNSKIFPERLHLRDLTSMISHARYTQ